MRTRAIIAVAALAALGATTTTRAEQPVMTCDAPVGHDATHASLVKSLGEKYVKFEKVDGAEGETIDATVIYPDDPVRRIEVFWFDEKKRAKPQTVRIQGENRTPFGPGVSVGLDIAAVERINGKPFVLFGFGWDMGGNVADWKGGSLAKIPGDCSVSVQFNPADDAPEKAVDKVSGDRRLSSADKAVRAAKPAISSITYGWAQK